MGEHFGHDGGTGEGGGVVGRPVRDLVQQGGAIVAPPDDPDDWTYQSALDAINDGWRVISFPNMALLALSADDPHGLGFEFILEKWS